LPRHCDMPAVLFRSAAASAPAAGRRLLMPFCPAGPAETSLAEDAGLGLLGRAGMVAVRVAGLASPCGWGLGKDGRSALAAAGAGEIGTGDLVVFCKPVAVAPAVVRRDGRVQAAGHPADHVRLGLAEERLDALTGRPDVIGEIARAVELKGKVKGMARRAMTPALAIRFTLLMTLMPDADYAEVMAALIGDLAAVPWQRLWAPPTATVVSTWREAVGPAPLEELQDMLLAAIDAEHRDHDYRAVRAGDLDAHRSVMRIMNPELGATGLDSLMGPRSLSATGAGAIPEKLRRS
jgi:hypothetical protein